MEHEVGIGQRGLWKRVVWACLVWLAALGSPVLPLESYAQAIDKPKSANQLSAAQLDGELVKETRPFMGTLVEITIWTTDREGAQKAIETVFAEIHRIERKLSEHIDTSDVAIINNNATVGPVTVGDDTLFVLKRAIRVGDASGGAFDMTGAVLQDLWDFAADHPVIPDPALIKQRLAYVDYRNVMLDLERKSVFLQQKNMRVGLQNIASGYAVDRAANLLYSLGFSSFMVDADGRVAARGRHGEQPWKIGIQHPRKKRGEVFAYVFLTAETMVTKGDYERWFVADGKRYHHILDPKTGFPTQGTTSATVFGMDGTLADAATTAVLALGAEKGVKLLAKLGLEGVIVKENGQIVVTPGLKKRLILPDKGPLEMGSKIPATTP